LAPTCHIAFPYRREMNRFRLPRFKRASGVAPMQLTSRDGEIIRLVHRHRFLRSSHIVALIAASPQQILRRLQLLYHHGYLERPRCQLDHFQQGGSHHIVYGIANKGAAFLQRRFNLAVAQHRQSEKNRVVGRVFLEHALMVSEVMVAIEVACRQSGRARLLTSSELPLPKDTGRLSQPFKWSVNVNPRLKLSIIPDRVFALEYPTQAGHQDRAYFFLEADRGTMPVARANLSQTSFRRKLLAYEATWSKSLHHSCFGFNRFRVLTITSSVERVKSLVNACSHLKSGHGLFLFTGRAQFENAANVFSLLWQTGKPGTVTTLLT